MEQVCHVLNGRTAAWLSRRRGTSAATQALEAVRYHQTRNAAARKSRIKHRIRRMRELLAL
jgi:hypothetical protein